MNTAVNEIGVLNEDTTKIISKYAWRTLNKIKKPSPITFDDLFQEGCIILLETKKYYKPGKVKFHTFLITGLLQHYCTIIQKSYKTLDAKGIEPEFLSTQCTTCFVDIPKLIERFSEEELKYISYILDVPERSKIQMSKRLQSKGKITRRDLNIPEYRESDIRRSIKYKLQKNYKNTDNLCGSY